MEEVVGVGAGICKAEKERPVMGAGAPRRGARSLRNGKQEKRVMLAGEKGENHGVGKPLGERGPVWLSWGLGGKSQRKPR